MSIIIAMNLGGAIADDDGICQGQSLAAGASATINGSLTSGGVYRNKGAAHKVKAVSAGNDSNSSLTFAGKFWQSNAVSGGDYTISATLDLGNATSVTSSWYAEEITGVVANAATASSITVGLTTDSTGVPVSLAGNSLWQITYAGTFGSSSVQLKRYVGPLDSVITAPVPTGEWVAIDTTTASALVANYNTPNNVTVKAFGTSLSATTQVYIQAEIINPMK